MNTTYAEQIRAIQKVRGLVENNAGIDSALNDAASTIAALNLTKDLPKPADQSREDYFDKMDDFFGRYYEITDLDEERKTRNDILAMSFDRIKELQEGSTDVRKALKLVNECLNDGIPVEKNDPIHAQIKRILANDHDH